VLPYRRDLTRQPSW